jgi:DNA mismatch repair protein MutL
MRSVIRLLPDNLANQIAAGEVVQRPASVVKELLENAKDAGATHIQLILRDAGKQLIQAIDNGCGMSPSDARMCFERHATSKITRLEDLFSIRTLGFRGEALASIAAVSQTQLKTRTEEDEIGSLVEMAGGEFLKQEPIATSKGSIISVKNLFFNVPARRNFLKSNPVELRHIIAELYHIALPNPHIHFKCEHNGQLLYNLPPTQWPNRIAALHPGLKIENLIEVKEDTPLLKIHGWIGEASIARKTRGEQYFFVNERYIKSAYLHHAVVTGYGISLPEGSHPFYVLGLWLEPEKIDINIHPTKTEIKFEQEKEIYALLQATIKKAIGSRYLSEPVYGALERQIAASSANLIDDELTLSQFIKNKEQNNRKTDALTAFSPPAAFTPKNGVSPNQDWNKVKTVYAPEFSAPPPNRIHTERQLAIFNKEAALTPEESTFFFPPRYILTISALGIEILDYPNALERILFEKILLRQHNAVQQLLYPYRLNYNAIDYSALKELTPELEKTGFILQPIPPDSILVMGVPFELSQKQVEEIFEQLIDKIKEGELQKGQCLETIALKIATRAAFQSYKKLALAEMLEIKKNLQDCADSDYSPAGKLIRWLIPLTDIQKKMS